MWSEHMNCKLIGNFVQHLEVTLEPGEEFYSERGSLIYLESGIDKEVVFSAKGIARLIGAKLSGESLFLIRLYNRSSRPLKLVIGSSYGLHPVKLNGETMICHRGVYVASNRKVDISTKLSIKGLMGGMGLMLQKISGTSTVFLDTKGTPIVLNLAAGETIEVDENHIIAIHNIPESRMNASLAIQNLIGGEGLSMMSITGPGSVYLSPGKFPPPVNMLK